MPYFSSSEVTTTGIQTLTNKTLTSPNITTNILPTSNDGASIGSTSSQFSDLFLAEGGVINWDNGDATLTQTGDVLAVSGAALSAPIFYTARGSQSCLTSTATAAVALDSPAVYLVTVYYASNEANNPYFETAIISTDGTTRSKVSIIQDGTTVTIGMSNLNMTITQTSGITLTMQWSVTRII